MFYFLALFAIITSIISAIIGMGGGILLLSVMTFFIPIKTAIPIHGLVQLVSNSSRVFFLKDHVKWDFYKFYLVGLPIGGVVSTLLLKSLLEANHVYILLLLLISYAVLKPKKMPHLNIRAPYWSLVGFGTGICAILVGAVGPLIAPFFLRDDISKEEIISTKAMMQTTAHLIKIPAFLFLSFDYLEYIWPIVLLSLGAILGTKLGIHILHKVDAKMFKFLYKTFLAIAGLRIVFKLLS